MIASRSLISPTSLVSRGQPAAAAVFFWNAASA
jgi:hypothetical protein